MAHRRWTFQDSTETYTMEKNPNRMTSPFPQRNVQAMGTTAVGGQPRLYEGSIAPYEWTFGGDIMSAVQYEALRRWVYDKKGLVRVSDHFGRVFNVILTNFDATPKRGVGKYWRHEYTIKCLVMKAPSVATVGEVPT